jgi:hypothetical protein
MRRVRLFGIASVIAASLVGRALAQDNKEDSSKEAKTEADLRSILTEDLKPLIEQEVERRLKAALEALKVQPPAAQAKPQEGPVTPAQIQELNNKVDQVIESQKKVLPGEFNPAIGLVGETVFSYHSRGSDQTGSDRPGGFDVWQRSLELNIAASVDPFFRAYAVINASADFSGGEEAALGVEEASLVSTNLPLNLTLQAGRFFAEIGRLANIHDHELPFVNRPLALDNYIGGEARTDGAQLNWLVPVDHYISLTVGFGDQIGGDAPPNNPGVRRALSELNFWGRVSSYFDLSPDWQLEFGVSGLLNPSADDVATLFPVATTGPVVVERKRVLAVLDFKVSYVPLVDNQFSGFTWGTELFYSHNRYLTDVDGDPATLGDQTLASVGSFGMYTYVTYKLDRQWSVSFLFDYFENAQDHTDVTTAYSPIITWATSHWNQIRLQFTHTHHSAVSGLPDDNAVYIQWAWIIGAHSHGWQQR